MGLSDPEIRFGTADEFVGGYLVRRHVASSGRKAHAMLPPSYVLGAKSPMPSPTYTYRPGGTGTPGTAPTDSCHIHGSNREGLTEPQQILYGRGSGPGVVVQ